jgi:hypothetical protein
MRRATSSDYIVEVVLKKIYAKFSAIGLISSLPASARLSRILENRYDIWPPVNKRSVGCE